MPKNIVPLLILFAILFAAVAIVFARPAQLPIQPLPSPSASPLIPEPSVQPKPEPVFCTMEAKQCPDGSYVGRTGPKCKFAPCPPAK